MGLELYEQGNPALIVDVGAESITSLDDDCWAACNIAVDPGNYELRLAAGTGEWLAQTIVASPGWQTQVFLLLRDYTIPESGEQSVISVHRRADLGGASILHARNGFDPSRPELRRAELARQALSNKTKPAAVVPDAPVRRLLPDEVRDLLAFKLDNPILGIYGAHLLLLEATPDLRLLEMVIRNLRQLLGDAHPDVEALALALGKPTPERWGVFATPPMLRRSWSMIVDATLEDPDLVPAESMASRVADRLWHEGAWHVWVGSGDEAAETSQERSDALVDILARRLQRRSVRAEATPARAPQRRSMGLRASQAARPAPAALSEKEMRSLARAFGIPRRRMESLLKEAAAVKPARRPSRKVRKAPRASRRSGA
jgi:hypothetical protein